jgi:hypothetical protein
MNEDQGRRAPEWPLTPAPGHRRDGGRAGVIMNPVTFGEVSVCSVRRSTRHGSARIALGAGATERMLA